MKLQYTYLHYTIIHVVQPLLGDLCHEKAPALKPQKVCNDKCNDKAFRGTVCKIQYTQDTSMPSGLTCWYVCYATKSLICYKICLAGHPQFILQW